MSSNAQVAHVWAAHNTGTTPKSSAHSSNGNFSFVGAALYSYSTEIARFETAPDGSRYVLCDTYGYSNTTSGKHYKARWSALHGLDVRAIRIERGTRGGSFRNWSAETIIKARLAEMAGSLSKAKHARAYKDHYERHAADALMDAEWIANAFGLGNAHEAIAKLQVAHEGLQAWSNVARFFGDYWKAAGDLYDAPLMALGDIAAGLEWLASGEYKSVFWERGQYQHRCNYYRRERPYELPTLLRVNGDTVETSHGAEFPLEHGLKALPRIELLAKHHHPMSFIGEGPRLGHFRVDSVSEDGTVKAGCHTVPLFAIRWAARSAGAIEAPELDHVADHLSTLRAPALAVVNQATSWTLLA